MKPATNVEENGSVLLNKDENEQVFRLLGHKCQVRAELQVETMMQLRNNYRNCRISVVSYHRGATLRNRWTRKRAVGEERRRCPVFGSGHQ